MKLEQNEKMLLFSETMIPDVFFSDYLSQLPGDYLKIYLYIIFLSKYKKDIKVNDWIGLRFNGLLWNRIF